MKKLFLPVLLCSLLGMASCSEDFEVAAPYKEITVAYSILNMYDTAHYVRIQKAFMDETKNALSIAQTPDSNFYASLDVKMIESNAAGAILNTLALTKVDLNNEGIGKETGQGTFFTNPNYAYKVVKPSSTYTFNPYYSYRIIINNTVSGRMDSSKLFKIVNGDSSNNASNFYIPQFININYSLAFPKVSLPSYTFELTGRNPLNSKMVEGHILFHYVDSNVLTGVQTDRTVDYLFDNDIQAGNGQFALKVENLAIFNFLRDEIGPAPDNIVRLFDSCDVKIFAGSEELYNYQQITLAQAGGLTGDQIKPIYTNMQSQNSLGIIASRAIRTFGNAPIDDITLDSMKKHPLLEPLKIRGRSSH